MGVLFQRSLLEKYVESCLDRHPDETPIVKMLEKWIRLFGGKGVPGELNLEQSFNEDACMYNSI